MLAILGAPVFLFTTHSVWVAPACLLGILILIAVLLKITKNVAIPAFPHHPAIPPTAVHGAILLIFFSLTFLAFYYVTDTWETWTWLTDSSAQYGQTLQTEAEADPTLFELLHKRKTSRWHGPHITHGLLHSKLMVSGLKRLVTPDTRRFTVNQVMRVLNSLCALGCIPLFFVGLRRMNIIRHVDVGVISALTSPGIFIVSNKGHWLGLSYGLACAAFFFGVTFLIAGKWRYLWGFFIAWSMLLSLYSGAQIFFLVCSGLTIPYFLLGRRVVVPIARIVLVIGAAVLMFYLLIGLNNPARMLRHFQGNGESLFEIRHNQIELNRYANYWQEAAPVYGLEKTLHWSLWHRAAIGMVERNARAIVKNFLASGQFSQLWFNSDRGTVKSFGFVLPWFLSISGLLLFLQRRWRDIGWKLFVLGCSVLTMTLLLFFTWEMSAHRVFSINLLLAALAGVFYDRVFCQCRIFHKVEMKLVLFSALYGQLFIVLMREYATIGL